MRIHRAKVPQVAADMLKALTASGAIETEAPREVQLDLESVLTQYIQDEQEITDKAKDLLAQRSLPPTEFPKLKKLLADQRNMKLGEEAVDYLLDQLAEILMHSHHVEEVFAADHELRRLMREPLRGQLAEEEKLQQEVRGQLRHVQEGTALWEVEYQRMMDDVRRRRGL